jgi:hypothetical protein
MTYELTAEGLFEENQRFHDTGGVSANNRRLGFIPAFLDRATGRAELSRFPDGSPAPVHTIAALPDEWVLERDHEGHAVVIKDSVVAGFLNNGKFYTREQAAGL